MKPQHNDHVPSRTHEELDAMRSYLSDLKERLDVALVDLGDMIERQRLADLKEEEPS